MMYRIVNLLAIVSLPNYSFSLIYSAKLYTVQRSSICNNEKKNWRESYIGNALYCVVYVKWGFSITLDLNCYHRGLIKCVVAWVLPLGSNTFHCYHHYRWFQFWLMLKLENHCYNKQEGLKGDLDLSNQEGPQLQRLLAQGWRFIFMNMDRVWGPGHLFY